MRTKDVVNPMTVNKTRNKAKLLISLTLDYCNLLVSNQLPPTREQSTDFKRRSTLQDQMHLLLTIIPIPKPLSNSLEQSPLAMEWNDVMNDAINIILVAQRNKLKNKSCSAPAASCLALSSVLVLVPPRNMGLLLFFVIFVFSVVLRPKNTE